MTRRHPEFGEPLSAREYEALALMARMGETSDRGPVAVEMGIALSTLQNTLAIGYEKLGVDGLLGAFRKQGWLNIDIIEGQVAVLDTIARLEAIKATIEPLLGALRK